MTNILIVGFKLIAAIQGRSWPLGAAAGNAVAFKAAVIARSALTVSRLHLTLGEVMMLLSKSHLSCPPQ